jgi:hypothetical protein
MFWSQFMAHHWDVTVFWSKSWRRSKFWHHIFPLTFYNCIFNHVKYISKNKNMTVGVCKHWVHTSTLSRYTSKSVIRQPHTTIVWATTSNTHNAIPPTTIVKINDSISKKKRTDGRWWVAQSTVTKESLHKPWYSLHVLRADKQWMEKYCWCYQTSLCTQSILQGKTCILSQLHETVFEQTKPREAHTDDKTVSHS